MWSESFPKSEIAKDLVLLLIVHYEVVDLFYTLGYASTSDRLNIVERWCNHPRCIMMMIHGTLCYQTISSPGGQRRVRYVSARDEVSIRTFSAALGFSDFERPSAQVYFSPSRISSSCALTRLPDIIEDINTL